MNTTLLTRIINISLLIGALIYSQLKLYDTAVGLLICGSTGTLLAYLRLSEVYHKLLENK